MLCSTHQEYCTCNHEYCCHTNWKMNQNCQNKNTCLIYKQNYTQRKGEQKNQTNPTLYLNNPDINHNSLLRRHSHTGIVFLSCCFLMRQRICMTTGALLLSSHAQTVFQSCLSASAPKPY